ncbi:MAG: DUF4339 domain-containing protein [Pseudomonadota bacterium]
MSEQTILKKSRRHASQGDLKYAILLYDEFISNYPESTQYLDAKVEAAELRIIEDKHSKNSTQGESKKESDILKEEARQSFESSEAVKKLKEKVAATLLKKLKQEQEHKKNEEVVWFYSKDANTREGPISFNELKSLYSNQTIDDDTLAWSPESDEWVKSKIILSKKQSVKSTATLPQVETSPITLGSSKDEASHKQNHSKMKYLLGVIVAIAIFIITAVVAKIYGLFISSILDSMENISEFIHFWIWMTKLIPWLLGIWLIKLSWKK